MLEGRRASGSKIRKARLAANMSQEDLARKVSVSTRNVVRWETGRTQPRLEHLLRVAEACQVSVLDLLEGDGDERDHEARLQQARLNVGLAVEQLLAVQS